MKNKRFCRIRKDFFGKILKIKKHKPKNRGGILTKYITRFKKLKRVI